MKKRLFSIITCISILCLTFTGCTSNSNSWNDSPRPVQTTKSTEGTLEAFFAEPDNAKMLEETSDYIFQQYKEIYSDIKIYAKMNTIYYDYTYRTGIEPDASAFESFDLSAEIDQAKDSIYQSSGIRPDDIIYIYRSSNGSIIYSSEN